MDAPADREQKPVVVVLHGSIGMEIVDALARLHLEVRRAGGCIRLRATPDELAELIELAGLNEVLREEQPLVDGGRQAEEREQALGVEEEADP